jgi:hypothetical protein
MKKSANSKDKMKKQYINWNNIPSGRNYDMSLFVGMIFDENWDMNWWLFE